MLLMECLSRAPADQLQRIAQTVGVEAGSDRRAVEEELVSSLTDRAWLQGILADLTDDEWAALKVVFYNGGDQGITVELCHQIVNLLSGKRRKTPAKAVEELQNKGLIYARTQNYRQVFFVPSDLLTALTDILSRQVVHRVCLDPGGQIRPLPPERDLLEDLHRFLAYVFKTEITLTQQGQIFKRHLRSLFDLLSSRADEDESLVGRYPEPLGLLMGYALERHLIARVEGRLQPTEDLQEWVDRPPGAKQLDLYGYWQDRYYYQDLQTFLSVMRSVGRQWVSMNQVVTELEPLINPSQRGSFLLRLKHHVSSFLVPLGLMELGEAGTPEDFALACRLTESGTHVLDGQAPTRSEVTAPSGFLLQATFEILVPRPADARILWTLELVADLTGRTDRTLTYRLSRQSVYRALKTGLSGDAMQAFLARYSSTGVPQNVAFDLNSWAAAYGQVHLQAVMLLRCTSPILAQQVRASRRTGRFILGELTPTDLIVDEEQYRELLEALEADGLMPRPGVLRTSHAKKQDA